MLQRSGSRPVREQLQAILDEAIRAGDADRGNLQVLNRREDALEIVAHSGFTPDFLAAFRYVRRTDGCACGRAWRLRQRISVPCVTEDVAFAPFVATAQAAGYVAVQSTPIIGSAGDVIGVLSTHFARPRQTSLAEGVLLDHYAAQAARAIEVFAAAAP